MKKGDIQYSDYSLNSLKLINVGEKLRFEVDTDGTLMDQLVAFWKMDEIGNGRHDALGKNHLTDNNRVSAAAGKKGNAAYFNSGRSQHLEIADNAELSMGAYDFSISIWVKLKSKGANRYIVSKEDSGTVREFSLYYDNTADRFKFEAFASGGGSVGIATADNLASPALDTWYHIACGHDETSNEVWIKVNNGTVNTTATTGDPADTAAAFRVGARNTTEADFWNGAIDDLGVWKKKLGDAEIADLYNSGNGNTVVGKREPLYQFDTDNSGELLRDLVAYWKLDETPPGAVATTRYDFVGLNHLTDNATVTQAAGKVGQSASFDDAASEYLSINDNADLSTGDIDFFIAGWIYTDDVTIQESIISKDSEAASGREYDFNFLGASSDKLRFFVFDGTNSVGSVTSTETLSANTWYFVAAYHDAVNNEIGISVNNGAFNTAATTGAPGDTGTAVNIGRKPNATEHWSGRIDELAFWKRKLTATEITDLYNSGSGQTIVDKNKQAGTVNKRFKIDTNGTLLTGLKAYWKLDEISGVRRDEIGTSDLTDNNTVTWKFGKQGRAGQFTRANSEQLTCPNNPDLGMADENYSVSCWVYLDTAPGDGTGDGEVITVYDSASSRDYRLVYDDTNTRFNFQVFDSAGTGIGTASQGTISANTWYHVIGWHDADNNQVGISVDNASATTAATTGTPGNSGATFRIGNGNSGFWNGRIDEVGIWKKVLTSQERTDLYNSGLGNTLLDEEGAL